MTNSTIVHLNLVILVDGVDDINRNQAQENIGHSIRKKLNNCRKCGSKITLHIM